MDDQHNIAIVANISWHLYNFRRGLIAALENDGFHVVLFAAQDDYTSKLVMPDRDFVSLNRLSRTGLNPLQDLRLLNEIVQSYRRKYIKVAIHYTSKGNIYGGLACRMLGLPSIHTINGLGGPFSGDRRAIQPIVTAMYRLALAKSQHVYFQNEHDRSFFIQKSIIHPQQSHVVDGSGINLADFDPSHFPWKSKEPQPFRAFMFSRLSANKGLLEYVEAARILKRTGAEIDFLLAGRYDHDAYAISRAQIAGWEAEGLLRYLGHSDRIQELIAPVDVVVYPSYYMEGIPRALIEAAAMAKPIITTDHVGCREAVVEGVNGFLVPVKDAAALADAIRHMAGLPARCRARMGENSRQLAIERFDENKINAAYLAAVRRLLA